MKVPWASTETTRSPMGDPWETINSMEIGIFIGVPWKTHGSSMAQHDKAMGTPWENHGSPMGQRYDPMEFPWEFHGILRDFHALQCSHRSPMGLPRVSHGTSMGFPLYICAPRCLGGALVVIMSPAVPHVRSRLLAYLTLANPLCYKA